MSYISEEEVLANNVSTKAHYFNLSKKLILKDISYLTFPKHFTTLLLCNSQIERIDGITFPDTLRNLFLHKNKITRIRNVYFPEGLGTLYLHGNDITEISDVYISPKTIGYYFRGIMRKESKRVCTKAILGKGSFPCSYILSSWWFRVSYYSHGHVYETYDALF